MSAASITAVMAGAKISAAAPLTNLLTDTTTRTMVSAGRPAYLVPRVDPIFGVPVTRISDDPGNTMTGIPGRVWGTDVRHCYMRHQAWNADESLLHLFVNQGGSGSGGGTWLNGTTYAPVYSRSFPAGWLEGHWHDTNPDLMIYCTSTQLRSLNVPANTTALIKDFGALGYSGVSLGLNEGEQSHDSDVWPITATLAGNVVCFLYKISTDQILAQVQPGLHKAYGDGGNHASPLGTYHVIFYDDETFRVYNAATGALVRTSTVLQQPSHYAIGLDTNGDEMIFGGDRNATGNIVKIRMSDGVVTTINPNSFNYHCSAANRSGDWVVGDYFQDSGVPYVNEIVVAAKNGSVRGRICHIHKGSVIDYPNEPHASISRTGKRCIFKSSWESGSSTPIGVYVADWRGFQLPGVG